MISKNLNEQIAEDRKLKLYATFKLSFRFEFYLDTISDFKIRNTLAKLHLSAHTLRIETGRFHKNKHKEMSAFVFFYKSSSSLLVVEDEIHFLITCSLFAEEREKC